VAFSLDDKNVSSDLTHSYIHVSINGACGGSYLNHIGK